ncbi:MAG: hypothetical protein ABIP50_02715 [Candidatus Saccharimonadales bacterium]
MTDFEIGRIEPTEHNAKLIQYMSLVDMQMGGHPDALKEANPNNADKVKAQADKLDQHPERYAGAFADDELVGFIKYDDWRVDLDMPFTHGTERIDSLIRRYVRHDYSVKGNPLGIMGLVSDPRIVDRYPEVAESDIDEMLGQLTDQAVDAAHSGRYPREIRVPHHYNDPARRATASRRFETTGQSAVVFGMKQELFSRPAVATELERFAAAQDEFDS